MEEPNFFLNNSQNNLTLKKKNNQENIKLPVAYASRPLKTAERNYSTIERKRLVVVLAVKHFKSCIMGMHFKIITDHNMLNALQSKNKL